MYGYHEKETLHLKIYLYNPDMIHRLSDLLSNGLILGEWFQVFEAHVPFNLQFLMDYNLFGMNLIYLNSFKFRRCLVEESSSGDASIQFNISNFSILKDGINSSSSIEQSFSEIWNLKNIDLFVQLFFFKNIQVLFADLIFFFSFLKKSNSGSSH
jgi:hypothetical protein